jgi:phenylalanyl-tRNA synthetase alpha chain
MSATPITHDALVDALTIRDLTHPAQGPHAMQLLVDAAVASLGDTSEIHLNRKPPVVPVEENYDRLGYPADAIARDSRYSRYVSDAYMLRGHTSAGVPSALRHLAAKSDADRVLVALPGICHRRDAIDRLHTGSPHQLDLWRLQRNRRRLDSGDLAELVDTVFAALLPGRTWQWTPAQHPYTLEGHQIDVIEDGQLVEVAECGLAAPAVLAMAGLDTRRWRGFRTSASSARPTRGSQRKCSTCRRTGRSRTCRLLDATCLSPSAADPMRKRWVIGSATRSAATRTWSRR